jgi:hypothetical protein
LESAVSKLERAAALLESARLHFSDSALDRASFASHASPLPELSAALATLGQSEAAWWRTEQSLARALFDEVSSREALPLADDERSNQDVLQLRLQHLDEQISQASAEQSANRDGSRLQELRLERTKQRLEMNRFTRRMSEKYGVKLGQPLSLEQVQQSLDEASAFVYWLDVEAPFSTQPAAVHYACVVQKSGVPT